MSTIHLLVSEMPAIMNHIAPGLQNCAACSLFFPPAGYLVGCGLYSFPSVFNAIVGVNFSLHLSNYLYILEVVESGMLVDYCMFVIGLDDPET